MTEIVKLLPGIQNEFQLGQKHVVMEANAPIEIDQVSVDVIEHLKLGALFGEKHGEPAGEGFHVAPMLGNERKDLSQKAAFATGPSDCGFCAMWCFQIMINALLRCEI